MPGAQQWVNKTAQSQTWELMQEPCRGFTLLLNQGQQPMGRHSSFQQCPETGAMGETITGAWAQTSPSCTVHGPPELEAAFALIATAWNSGDKEVI